MSLEDYEILEEIGRGARGVAYRAIDIINRREVVIKSGGSRMRYEDEVENHLKINHLSCVPKLYNHFSEVNPNGVEGYYLVMELIQGENLFRAWRDNRNWDFNWMTVYHALLVIEELHQAGFYHGDIHLANLIWTGQKMYLIDFDNLGEIQPLRDASLRMMRSIRDELELGPNEEIEEKLRLACSDYQEIFNKTRITGRLRGWADYDNFNFGLERYDLLIQSTKSLKCEEKDYDRDKYIPYEDYFMSVLSEYVLIDSLSNEEILSQLGDDY